MAFDGTLKFDTAIDTSGFFSGISGLAAKAIALAGTAVSALGTYAVNVGKDFESSMAQVIATMGITKDTIVDGVNSYDLLSEAAAEAGETTTFSASEAADALNYLALAGYDAAQAAEALPAVLDLAAAGGLDLAYASDLATDAMAALGIEATSENLTRFGDEMAKTASKANTSVSQLGEAILTVGGTAQSLAGGTTELNSALGVLANRGIKGAEGGTHLRNMILSLSAPTDTAKNALDSLGVSALDADGNMRPLNETFSDLDKALEGMSDGEKSEILSDIFNKTDLAAAQAMLAGCGDEFDDLTAALNNCDGAMSQMADTMNDTLEGDIKSLSSKAEAFGIAIYEDMNEPLRELAQKGGEYVSQLTEAFREGGFEGLLSSLGSVLADAVTYLSSYVPMFVEAGVSLVSSLIEGLSENAPAIADAALDAGLQLLDGILSISADIFELGASLLTTLLEGLSERIPDIAETAVTVISSLIESITASLPELLSAIASISSSVVTAVISAIPALLEAVLSALPDIIEAIITSIPEFITAIGEIVLALVEALPEIIEMLIEALPEIITAIVEALIEAAPQILEAAGTMLMAIVEALPQITLALNDGLSELLSSIGEFLVNALAKVAEWALSLREKAIEAAEDFIESIVEFFSELPEKIGEFLTSAIESIIEWGAELRSNASETASSFLENIRTFFSELPGNIASFLTAALTNVVQWGVSLRDKAREAASGMMTKIVDTIKELPGKMLEAGKNLVEGLWNGITGMGTWLKDKILDFGSSILDGFKSAFGISSPSKVMRDKVGKFIAQGIGTGFTEEMPAVTGQAVRAAEQLIPEIESSAVSALHSQAAGAEVMTGTPSATSEIISNSFTYSTVNNSSGESGGGVTIHAQFVVGEEVVSEGVIDTASDKLDQKQGLKVVMKKRGLAT